MKRPFKRFWQWVYGLSEKINSYATIRSGRYDNCMICGKELDVPGIGCGQCSKDVITAAEAQSQCSMLADGYTEAELREAGVWKDVAQA